MTEMYPPEILSENDDDGTMPENLEALRQQVVGHKIVSIERVQSSETYYGPTKTLLTLDNGKKVTLIDSDDCCAFTEIEDVILHLDKIDHVITGVGTTDWYTTWHIYADFGDVAELKVGWSCGNPFYYGYGFNIKVEDDLTDN